jgi:hypothetical protein
MTDIMIPSTGKCQGLWPVLPWFTVAFIHRCMGIYMDAINIFIRILTLLAGSGNRRK